jgi:hypothetical protein
MKRSHGGQAQTAMNNPQGNNALATMSSAGASSLSATTATAQSAQGTTGATSSANQDNSSDDEDIAAHDSSATHQAGHSFRSTGVTPEASSPSSAADSNERELTDVDEEDSDSEDARAEVEEHQRSQEAEIAALRRQIEERDARIDFLEEMVAQMARERVR